MKRKRSLQSETKQVDPKKKQQLMVSEQVSTLAKPKMNRMLRFVHNFIRQNTDSFVCKDIENIILHYWFEFEFMIAVSQFWLTPTAVWEINHGSNMKNIFAHNKKFLVFRQSNALLVFDCEKMCQCTMPLNECVYVSTDRWRSRMLMKTDSNQFYFGEINSSNNERMWLTYEDALFPANQTPLHYVETMKARGMITTSHQWAGQKIKFGIEGWDPLNEHAIHERAGMRVDNLVASNEVIVGTSDNEKSNIWWINTLEGANGLLCEVTYFVENGKKPISFDACGDCYLCITEDHKLYFGDCYNVRRSPMELPTEEDVYQAQFVQEWHIIYFDKDDGMHEFKVTPV